MESYFTAHSKMLISNYSLFHLTSNLSSKFKHWPVNLTKSRDVTSRVTCAPIHPFLFLFAFTTFVFLPWGGSKGHRRRPLIWPLGQILLKKEPRGDYLMEQSEFVAAGTPGARTIGTLWLEDRSFSKVSNTFNSQLHSQAKNRGPISSEEKSF